MLSYSDKGDRSWESKNYNNGVFTKNLLAVLRANGMRLDKDALFRKLREKVSWEVKSDFGKSQVPQVGGAWKGSEINLSVKASEPRDAGHAAFDGLSSTGPTSGASHSARPSADGLRSSWPSSARPSIPSRYGNPQPLQMPSAVPMPIQARPRSWRQE